jgi:hypothetical protein
MIIIQHRINTIEALQSVPVEFGVETDMRPGSAGIIHHHDPFAAGPLWSDYLQQFNHRLLIANIKSEGIEQQVIDDMAARSLDHYFLLDVSLPFMVKLAAKGHRNMAVRFSEYEPIELATRFAGKLNWVWVDCFTQLPLTTENHSFLKQHFKTCIVSPELHGHPVEMIAAFRQQLQQVPADAVCTRYPELWQ